MTESERKRLIDRYAEGGNEVTTSLDGFPAGQLTAHPIPGKWSAREIVHHLGDSETTSALRLRKLLSEEHPVIHSYDEAALAIALRYNDRDHVPPLQLFVAARAVTVPVLRSLSDADWTRQGWHTEMGLYTPEIWLEIYAEHAHKHAGQIARARASARP